MQIVLVVAMDRDGWIGRDGGLPWRLPADLARFKALTIGHPVVMGRRTCLSLPKPLPGRENLVLSRDPGFAREGFRVVRSPEAAVAAAAGAPALMVIGGAAVYGAFLPRADRIEQTLVDASTGGDTRFPIEAIAGWIEAAREVRPADAKNPHPMVFRTLLPPPGGGRPG